MNTEVKSGKLTELGVIPEEWNCCSVEHLVSDGILEKPMDGNHGNIHPKSSDFVSDGIPFVMANNIKDGSVDLRNCSFIRKSQADNLQKGFSKPGDVLLTHKATIGQVAVVGCIKTEYIMLTPQVTYYRVANTSQLYNGYLRHFFESDAFQRVLQSMSGGGTRSYIGITAQRLLPVLIPPLAEQLTIAEYLSDCDALINCLDQLIAKKIDIKQAAMQQLLTGQRRLPGFSGEWKVKRLGELANIKTGSRNNQDKDEDGQYPFFVRSATVEYINSFSLDCEAILVPGEGNIGRIFHYINGRFDVHQRVYAITQFSPDTSGKFVYLYMTMHFGAHAMQNSVKATVDSLRLPTFQNFEITLPPSKDEQTAIATILSDMDNELETLETRRNKARQLKQGMMQELLTGRIRLINQGA